MAEFHWEFSSSVYPVLNLKGTSKNQYLILLSVCQIEVSPIEMQKCNLPNAATFIRMACTSHLIISFNNSSWFLLQRYANDVNPRRPHLQNVWRKYLHDNQKNLAKYNYETDCMNFAFQWKRCQVRLVSNWIPLLFSHSNTTLNLHMLDSNSLIVW